MTFEFELESLKSSEPRVVAPGDLGYKDEDELGSVYLFGVHNPVDWLSIQLRNPAIFGSILCFSFVLISIDAGVTGGRVDHTIATRPAVEKRWEDDPSDDNDEDLDDEGEHDDDEREGDENDGDDEHER